MTNYGDHGVGDVAVAHLADLGHLAAGGGDPVGGAVG